MLYYMFNKPQGCVTARSDAIHRTVMDYLPAELAAVLHPVGRLDKDTCGLLQKCTASYHDDAAGVHTNIVYGDFFLIEALLKLAGRDAKLWYSREASAL